MERKVRINIVYAAIAFACILLLQSWWQGVSRVEVIPYSEFQKFLTENRISEIVVTERHIRGTLKSALPDGNKTFTTTRVEPVLAETFSKYGIKVTGGTDETVLKSVASWLLPMVLFLGIWMFVIRRFSGGQGLGGGMMSIGKSKAKVFVENDIQVSFDDVAGVDEAKTELQEIVAFLKNPDTYGRLGARLPKGVLLVGPPGTGKTLIARAVAGEAGVPFFSISGSEFVEMFVGVGAARVRDLFEQARKTAPCIIFIDELDALGRARGAFPGMGGHDEKEQTLNQLLMELDGFDPSKENMVLLAATNRPEILDPALLRAGRFDRQVLVDRPDRLGRVQILRVHLKKVELSGDVDEEAVAGLTPGFTGADLANLVNEAALLATRRGGDAVAMADFVEAIERIIAGLEKKNRLLNPKEREVVAHHEIGHAITALALPGTDKVQKVSIIPRGIGSLGYTIQRPTEDRFLMTRQELENKMAVLLGGRAAEILIFGNLSTGAADDLNKATDIAHAIVTRYGMDETLGEMTYESERPLFLGEAAGVYPERRGHSEVTAREIDCAVRALVHTAFERASSILTAHRDTLVATAKTLLEAETLSADDLPTIAPWDEVA
ncbi:MAG: ATP-dependent zinc metalloprotease FtsH [Rhodospirillaceae bacterium]|jgi:cell division protease FtsH|nr:ATP-dependent zinc metalloprotease FtsH [Rhodospirillaceae bacterium]MBT5190823.1 ATP-dependent zinc metalloprotease FtsH [Rhodospirillaceae bacterium]MBT5895301.1 ATP-dependent zinc metalloprotease FtsH [Rhodospirillaceae bacterium]